MADYHSTSRLLRLDSRHITGNKYNTVFSLKEPQLQDARRVVLKSAKIPNTQFNVNKNNNTWNFPNAVNLMADYVVPIGQYTMTSLIAALETLVPGLTITQNATTKFLTLSMANAFGILADPESNPFGYYILGGRVESLGVIAPITLSAFPDLSGLQTVYITSNTLAPFGGMASSDRILRNAFCSVPIGVEFGLYHTHEEESSLSLDFSQFSSRNINSIDINLIDAATMKTIDLNGLDYELTFRVYN